MTSAAKSDAIGPRKFARLFRNGANQAVRIPREFEFSSDQVTIRKEGTALIIEPAVPQYPKGSVQALLSVMETMKSVYDALPDVDQGLLGLDDIKL